MKRKTKVGRRTRRRKTKVVKRTRKRTRKRKCKDPTQYIYFCKHSTKQKGGRRRKCCKCKRKCGKRCTCRKGGKCLKSCHCKRRGNKRRKTKRRRTMRGGTWLNKGTTFKNPIGLNKNVIDTPNPSRNDLNLPGVKVGGKRYQRGGGAMDIVPGWNDLRDVGRSVLTGGQNFINQMNGDRALPSPLPDRDQYQDPSRPTRDFPDIGNLHLNAEQQASNFRLDQA